ncbi:hypothetical protein [Bosea sp. WAO]|uniref:hypothetical protein n=1 Tax=Bosea sp. WAO TaxID=406341 RepID=UPI000AEB1AE2|nr:hypothetical protein [Bosea sp. WAO]
MSRRMVLAMGLAGALGLAMAPQAQAAGFLDDLARIFGARPTPPAMIGRDPFIGSDPFEMTVKPKRQKPRAAAASTKPAEPAVKLDPATDPHWYLHDPTLRKGDILVTRGGVVVFDGRSASEHSPAAFTALGDTKRLPKAQQQTLQAAAAGGRAYFRNDGSVSPAALIQKVNAENAISLAQ